MEEFLQRLLDDRELRSKRQEALIDKHKKPIISYMLNTPGREKSNERLIKFHNYGFEKIKDFLEDHIIEYEYYPLDTGMYYLISVDQDPLVIKKKMIDLEEEPGGRLFDIDVFNINKEQISRTELGGPRRKCLVCGQDAKNCIVGRKHSYQELVEKMYEIIDSII